MKSSMKLAITVNLNDGSRTVAEPKPNEATVKRKHGLDAPDQGFRKRPRIAPIDLPQVVLNGGEKKSDNSVAAAITFFSASPSVVPSAPTKMHQNSGAKSPTSSVWPELSPKMSPLEIISLIRPYMSVVERSILPQIADVIQKAVADNHTGWSKEMTSEEFIDTVNHELTVNSVVKAAIAAAISAVRIEKLNHAVEAASPTATPSPTTR